MMELVNVCLFLNTVWSQAVTTEKQSGCVTVVTWYAEGKYYKFEICSNSVRMILSPSSSIHIHILHKYRNQAGQA